MSFSVMKNFLKSQNLCGGKGELFNLEAHTHKKKKDGTATHNYAEIYIYHLP